MFFFFAVSPPRRSLTHCGLGRFRQGSGGVFFFCCGPAGSFLVSLKRPGGAAAKKKHHGARGGVFFCCGPAQTLTHSLWAGAISARFGWCFFFVLWPRPVFLGNSKKCLVYYIGSKKTRRATTKKKHKKNHGAVFFFCCGPARTLTHSLRAWVVPPPRRGGVFFFCCGPARTGVVFFFLLWPRPDAHSLTVGWGDFGKVRVVFFFLLWPRRVFFG